MHPAVSSLLSWQMIAVYSACLAARFQSQMLYPAIKLPASIADIILDLVAQEGDAVFIVSCYRSQRSRRSLHSIQSVPVDDFLIANNGVAIFISANMTCRARSVCESPTLHVCACDLNLSFIFRNRVR
jgi:hypothetical protein